MSQELEFIKSNWFRILGGCVAAGVLYANVMANDVRSAANTKALTDMNKSVVQLNMTLVKFNGSIEQGKLDLEKLQKKVDGHGVDINKNHEELRLLSFQVNAGMIP